jgi:hypothetical protein
VILVCYVLFGLGIVAYGLALAFINASAGETFSDVGNAFMLLTAVLLLFQLVRAQRDSAR